LEKDIVVSNPDHRNEIYIIAEMACSHDGVPDLARKIIDGAGNAQADAIQFQIWKLAEMMVPHHPEFPSVSEIELTQEEWRSLAQYTRDRYPGMEIIACVYERSSVDFCETFDVDAYKIHSSDLSNPYLIEYVSATGRRIDLSVGASTLDEIETAIEWIKRGSDAPIWLMYGYQNFPTLPEETDLLSLLTLRERFGLPVGYQDHSDAEGEAAFWLPAMTLGMGVDILEKHITHDRSQKGFDHEAALNPDEFNEFVRMVRTLEIAKGKPLPRPFSEEENKYRKYSKKSLVAARNLAAGDIIQEEDLTFMRAPELGLPPDQKGKLIGKQTKHEITQHHLIQEDDVE
jgi:sialic acid synthase SpsE